jgi:hypothetical protein
MYLSEFHSHTAHRTVRANRTAAAAGRLTMQTPAVRRCGSITWAAGTLRTILPKSQIATEEFRRSLSIYAIPL